MTEEYEKQEAYYAALDTRVEDHLDYILTDAEVLGQQLIIRMQDDPFVKTLLKNLLRDMAREEVLTSLNLI